ncbi:MAG TPA: PASTA domain-containing protein [Nocardioides sp.]|uniref:PASTA domain-containing protein n=1 Tax=Nocardioides sp. TaxID=35761 RepID=UPI002E34C92B|nr:PASTA domain-containing protein [Nocardioides sp.]HEX3931949.1 PASTA domain-containing protein [Nocardioides sp.]
MTEDRMTELLERTASRIPASDPPLGALLRDGRRGLRRRRVGVVAASVVVVVVVAGVGTALISGGHRDNAPSVEPGPPPPPPPAGTRWAGIGRTVVAVPRGWSMWPGLYCSSNDGHDHVTIVEAGVTVGCYPNEGSLPPTEVVALEERDGTFQVQVDASPGSHSTHAVALQRRVEASRTTLSTGWLAVPLAASAEGVGASTADAEASALRAAGLRVSRVQEPAWDPGPQVRTVPAVGTPVKEGSTVIVYERVTPPASASMAGRLLWVGGPSAVDPAPHAGTVHVVGDGLDEYVAVHRGGRWSFQGPAGTYAVTASSPGYLSAAGVPDSCRADHRVRMRWTRPANVDVYCQLR